MNYSSSWYQNAVFYEIYVRAFCDSNGDGTATCPACFPNWIT